MRHATTHIVLVRRQAAVSITHFCARRSDSISSGDT
jgi:hypothetical protein